MTLQTIFQLRQAIDRQAQPSFRQDLDRLDNLWTINVGVETTPFDRTYHRDNVQSFRNEAHRYREPVPLCPIVTPLGGYLYRICGLKDTINYLKWNSDRRHESEETLYEYFDHELRDSDGTYLRFNDFRISGMVKNGRGFTWWSNAELSPPNFLRMVFKRGVSTDSLRQYNMVIRCALEKLGQDITIGVPSVLHGYDSPLFCPVLESKEPTWGQTLDLSDVSNIRWGELECVISPIPANLLEFAPVELNWDAKDERSLADTSLLKHLETFFTKYAQRLGFYS